MFYDLLKDDFFKKKKITFKCGCQFPSGSDEEQSIVKHQGDKHEITAQGKHPWRWADSTRNVCDAQSCGLGLGRRDER